jgi:hypothetical protein
MAELRAQESELRIPLGSDIKRALAELATEASTPERPVTPEQVAVQLLAEAVAKHRKAV